MPEPSRGYGASFLLTASTSAHKRYCAFSIVFWTRAYRIVGITYSAPVLIPVGQREVTVLRRV